MTISTDADKDLDKFKKNLPNKHFREYRKWREDIAKK